MVRGPMRSEAQGWMDFGSWTPLLVSRVSSALLWTGLSSLSLRFPTGKSGHRLMGLKRASVQSYLAWNSTMVIPCGDEGKGSCRLGRPGGRYMGRGHQGSCQGLTGHTWPEFTISGL